MVHATERAFILPYALLMGSVLLVLSLLFLQMGTDRINRMDAEALQRQAANTLRLNVRPMVAALEAAINEYNPSSALLQQPANGENRFRSTLIVDKVGGIIPLSSRQSDPSDTVTFVSSYSSAVVEADLTGASPQGAATNVQLAWAIQDLSIMPGDIQPPDFWPLPDWYWAHHTVEQSVSGFLDEATHGQWRGVPWVPREEPLPFKMDQSPALVPVVESLTLRIGIFASGPVRSREKIIRARFYLEGTLWNPYNRNMRVHYGSGMRSMFQLIFCNLPEVRIHNLDLGVSTSWIPLDEATNDYTGKTAFHGWIRMPPELGSGQRIHFIEPEENWQPEGLARTLHPAFMVGPADHVEIEFRESPGGVYVACLPLGHSDPFTAALDGSGWFRLEGFPLAPETIEFKRADEGNRPFYLSGGSLSFRRENAHLAITFAWKPNVIDSLCDTRRRILNHDDGRDSPEGAWIWDRDLADMTAVALMGQQPDTLGGMDPTLRTPLFSWPELEPESLIAASDLPQWRGGFRIGSPGAHLPNHLLDHQWAWPISDPEQSIITLVDREGTEIPFRRSFPVNLLSESKWESIISTNAINRYPLQHAAYPWTRSAHAEDFLTWPSGELSSSTRALIHNLLKQPVASVSQFFNEGRLVNCLLPGVMTNPLRSLVPLRGFLRTGPLPRLRGSAWLLQMAVRVSRDGFSFWRSAQVWLLETRNNGQTHLEVIQFQWTHPDTHLTIAEPA